MKPNKLLSEFLSLLWILLFYQIPSISCASLKNYSKSLNITITDVNVKTPKTLSEMIEFSPLNVPVKSENITFMNEDLQDTSPKFITFKLKTRVFVQNPNNSNNFVNDKNGEVKAVTTNFSESSLSDIEYADPSDDLEFWGWKLSNRSRRISNLDQELEFSLDNDSDVNNSSEKDISKNTELDYESGNSEENKIQEQVHLPKGATGRQFVFHPYLPYGKDVPPDEKISFHDIIPIKMVKFIKSMVEDAPWEQMFMKMVRMIVDQFVDKIIEKMFADKDHDHDIFKKRSFDLLLSPTFVVPTFQTPIVRLRRAVGTKTSPSQDEEFPLFLAPKRVEQDTDGEGKKSALERRSWLDQFLDFLFPNSKTDASNDEAFSRLRKRDTTNTRFLKTLLTFFLTSFEKSSGFITDAKDVLRYKMLKDFLPFLYQKMHSDKTSNVVRNTLDNMKMSHRELPDDTLARNKLLSLFLHQPRRMKRSAEGENEDDIRLWQAHYQRHNPKNRRSHDECSLRRACNAGRLLSRIPSVQEITLQLRSHGNEPHWDALVWGMKKKRCSRIFCKRQRSPKGSRSSWNTGNERSSRKDEIMIEDGGNDQSNEVTL